MTVITIASSAVWSACATHGGGATTTAAPAPAPAADRGDTLPSTITAVAIKTGENLFNGGSCAKCHGQGGKDGTYGPNLTDTKWLQISGKYDELVRLITRGVPAAEQKSAASNPQFAMRPRGGMGYSDEQIQAVAAYVWSLSHPGVKR